jgi:signal transduction histidine kinase
MDHSPATLAGLRASGHLCFPYESEDERRRVLIAFVREGLARHERCVYIGLPDDQSAFVAALRDAGVPALRALERGELVLATQAETYLRSGAFDPDDALALMTELTDRALADGFAGLRATGEASGPLPDELWPRVMRYEALLNERLGRRPFVGLCRFPSASVPPERVRDVLRTHPFALVRGEVCANPFYERPEVVLSDDSRSRLDWQLHQLRAYNRALKRLEARSAVSDEAETARERSSRARDRFLAVLADELADPLFALKREVHALGVALDDAPAPERLEAAQRHLRRLSAVVDQARDVARLLAREPGAASASTDRLDAECDLVAVVREAADGHDAALAEAGVTVVIDAPGVVRGAWDREAVQRLVSTFLHGAAARRSRRPVTIGVHAHDGGATLTFNEGTGASRSESEPDGAGYAVELPWTSRRPRD